MSLVHSSVVHHCVTQIYCGNWRSARENMSGVFSSSHPLLSFPSFFHAVGIATCSYFVYFLSRRLISGFRGYVLPRFARQCNTDLANKYGNWAVVTGATDGIGLAYAKELAARKVNIVLISRTEEKLRRVSTEIENEFAVQTKFIVADFTEGRRVYEKIEKELTYINVGILVNNVGTFMTTMPSFVEMSENMIWDMVNVNVLPVLLMTKMLLPRMKENRKGAIVNVSSLSEQQPMPLAALYAATKVLVRNFTIALQHENRESGVTIQILSPGAVRTNLSTFTDHKIIHPNECISPLPKDFARQAIGTLGILDYTSGFWTHGLMVTLLELIPECLRTKIFEFTFKAVKKSLRPIANE